MQTYGNTTAISVMFMMILWYENINYLFSAILYAYENGMVIMCPDYGAIVLHSNHIRSACFFDGVSMS